MTGNQVNRLLYTVSNIGPNESIPKLFFHVLNSHREGELLCFAL